MSSVARIDHPVVEVVPIADDFVQGIVTIEDLGDNARFVLYAYHSVYERSEERRVGKECRL